MENEPAPKLVADTIDPDALKNLLIGFMGQTYREVSEFDKNLISSNATLSPKKKQFESMAQKLLNEVNVFAESKTPVPVTGADNAIPHIKAPIRPQQIQQTHNPVYVNTVNPDVVEVDPNQMEFNFDNSATAQSIQNTLADIMRKLESIESRIDKLSERKTKEIKKVNESLY